ncbi:MAG: hypothetical protein SNJ52_01995, partial [Verrucomicrobiia bacterium]
MREVRGRIEVLHPHLSKLGIIGSYRLALNDAGTRSQGCDPLLIADPCSAEALIVLLPELEADPTLGDRLLHRFPLAQAVALVGKATSGLAH